MKRFVVAFALAGLMSVTNSPHALCCFSPCSASFLLPDERPATCLFRTWRYFERAGTSFFAAKVVFYCWPYAPSLIHVVSASAARRWRVERGEYSGTGPAIPPPLTRCAHCCFGELRIARSRTSGQIQL
jgi:hypothetical protein